MKVNVYNFVYYIKIFCQRILLLNIANKTENSEVSVAIFTCCHTMCAAVGASLKVECYKLKHRVTALNRLSIVFLVLLVSVDVSLLCCFVC